MVNELFTEKKMSQNDYQFQFSPWYYLYFYQLYHQLLILHVPLFFYLLYKFREDHVINLEGGGDALVQDREDLMVQRTLTQKFTFTFL